MALTLPGLLGAVGGVAVAVGLQYGVGLLGVRRRENPLSALRRGRRTASTRPLEGQLLQRGSDRDQVPCGEREEPKLGERVWKQM